MSVKSISAHLHVTGKNMACIFEIKLSASDVIALLAMLVSGLSALYARWSWSETKKANRISLLSYQREIYDAFFELKMHMVQKAEFAELSEVSKFYYQPRNAKIYLPSALATDIQNYFDACFWVADTNRKFGGISKESRIECKRHLEVEDELAPKIETEFFKLLQQAQN
jgi:hypothetical protein